MKKKNKQRQMFYVTDCHEFHIYFILKKEIQLNRYRNRTNKVTFTFPVIPSIAVNLSLINSTLRYFRLDKNKIRNM